MGNIIIAISIGAIIGVAYYIFKNTPPNGGFGGRIA